MSKLCLDEKLDFCPVESTIEMISGKWKGRILWKLYHYGTMRFGEMRKALGSITEKMLSRQLRDLETLRLVKRNVFREVPPKVEYSLTDFGRSMGPILDRFAEWGVANKRKVRALVKTK